ncbi:MAG: YD repeat protein [Candidatus Saccharicenans subterraneus]|uniref:YD repeat protein n=1 Tax=Candidatus Saccharicenans subterraneus TaxID=2508984 RepID=A0A3E2BKN7_9BACT|nr:MAG: YD repeat protein [Candidatus Saccharicenans subterraneum]
MRRKNLILRVFSFLPSFLLIAFLFIGISDNLFAQYGSNGIFDRIGIIAEHGFHGAVPEENIDLFTGNLTLKFLDIQLPGPNNFDLVIWRVYNSKILRDRIAGNPAVIQQEPYSWVGLGWSLHMGRLHYANNKADDTPVIEFPDGRWETAYPSIDFNNSFLTRQFLKLEYDNSGIYRLHFRDGTIWTFGAQANIQYINTSEQVKLVTRIEDSYGHHIDITYKNGLPVITQITDSLGRTINFISEGTTNPKLVRIEVKNATGQTVNYYYSVGTFSGGYYKLTSYDPPELSASTYEYNSTYELVKVNTSYGGSIEYSYNDHDFYYYNMPYVSRVLTQKKIKFDPGDSGKLWLYSYPSYANGNDGTVTVQGPESIIYVTYNGTGGDPFNSGWGIGLIKQKYFNDGSYSEIYSWISKQISNYDWIAGSLNLGKIKAPVLLSLTKSTLGDCPSKEEYEYDSLTLKYGLPRKIKYYGAGSFRYYKQLGYFFEDTQHGGDVFLNKYMVSHIGSEKVYSSSGSLLKENNVYYFTDEGKCGAIKKVQKKRGPSETLVWDYTYQENTGTKTIIITINPPGNNSGIETCTYMYGALAKIERPGYVELNRSISQYDSSILTETNQHGGTYSFSYDNLGRITNINMPSGFNPISATWSTNSVTITQGNHKIIKYWDGLGRDLGHEEQGDGIALYYRKTRDAEGRVIKENKGSINASDQYCYFYNGAGRLTQIKDPLNNITTYTYSDKKTIIKDSLNNQTELTFDYLPGLVKELKDPSGKSAIYTYDDIGRLKTVVYNGARTQSYDYDFLDNVVSESHPETGLINYAYNSENLLSQKSHAGTTISYEYNTSNQLKKILTVDETINYIYDSLGRIARIYSSKGWERNNINYNVFGSVEEETQVIPGLGSKTTKYEYDGNNVLKKVVYADGRSVIYTNNSLNVPEMASFNGQTLVSQVSYGTGKQPTGITISGNQTEYTASYNSIGQLISASLMKSGTPLYGASYSYDAVGNIISITNTNPLVLNASFTYDNLYRLKTAAYTPSGVGRVNNFEYSYDQYGNLTQVKEIKDNETQIFSMSYNTKNQRADFTFDSRGNLLTASGYQYEWDALNRLSRLQYGTELRGKYLYNERGLRIRALPALPEINLRVGSNNIPDGSQVELRAAPGSYVDKTFTIENLGDAILNLYGSPIVVISGPDSNQFAVIQQPASSLAPGGSTNFIIRFSPSSAGIKTAVISLVDNDLDENPYEINLIGTEPVPDINLKLDGADLPNGQAVDIPCNLNGTADKSFAVENTGDAQLVLTGNPPVYVSGPDADQFSVVQMPSSVIEPGQSSAFIIRFSPTSPRNKSATITLSNNDPDENPYQINLVGIVIEARPEIEIETAMGQTILCGSYYDFGTVLITEPTSESFLIRNLGTSTLTLTGYPPVDCYGQNRIEFLVTQPVTTSINPGQSSVFSIALSPITPGYKIATISIKNDDTDENPYTFNVIANVEPGQEPSGLKIEQPESEEELQAGSLSSITWKGGSKLQRLDIEYSIDNGSSFIRLAQRYENKGKYAWRVPSANIPAALVRLTDADGLPFESEVISYELFFKVNKFTFQDAGLAALKLGLAFPDQRTNGNWQSSIIIKVGNSGKIEGLRCGIVEKDINSSTQAINRWHHLQTIFDRRTYSLSTFLDGMKIIEDAPMDLSINVMATPEITLVTFPGAEVLIDDLVVKVWDTTFNSVSGDTGEPLFLPVLKERFENYISDEELSSGGWKVSKVGEDGQESVELLNVLESCSGLKSLRLSTGEGAYYVVNKSIALPERYPFDVSDEGFGIRAKSRGKAVMEEEARRILALRERSREGGSLLKEAIKGRLKGAGQSCDLEGRQVTSLSLTESGVEVQSVGTTGTYYIYSFDGKLLAEYNGLGECMRDYIYLGDRLLAEYQPQSGALYYYTLDHINSVRVVTDGAGNRVFAAAYDPYGGIQKIWENSYTPAMKFSGKERDSESSLDYFGARYYGSYYYRWLSPDPVINKDAALTNPQLWNLYTFCRNNPVTYWDPDGAIETSLTKLGPIYNKKRLSCCLFGWFDPIEKNILVEEADGKFSASFKYHAYIAIILHKKDDEILEHEQHHAAGYEWLYVRNVEEFKKAEMQTFESKEEAFRFGVKFYEKTVNWRPFKWKLHDPNWPKIGELQGFNFFGAITHRYMWKMWYQKNDWD